MKIITYGYYKLQFSEDGKAYQTMATINAKNGYEHAVKIADELTDGQFSMYKGGFYYMSETVTEAKIYE
jgi:hypothetical protein